MASIFSFRGGWRVQIRLKGHDPLTKDFPTKGRAEQWAQDTENRLRAGKAATMTDITVGQVIAAYRALREKGRPILDTSNEHYELKQLDAHLGPERVEDLTPTRMAAWASARAAEGAGPYTVNMNLSKLGTVLRLVASVHEYKFPDVVGAARPLLKHNRLIGSGGRRERRPTEDELQRILERLGRYRDALVFDALVGLRRGELVTIDWQDIDRERHLVRVMRKHPRLGKVEENVPILGLAWAILEELSEAWTKTGRIFPFHPQTLSKAWKAAVDELEIPDLQLRDLRHEGISGMFEAGFDIPQVALVSGHKKWETLKRYTQLKPEHLTEPDRGIQRRRAHQRIASLRPRTSGKQTPPEKSD